MREHHNREYQERINAHKESHDPENPRSLIDTYITRMNQERKANPNTNFSGKSLALLRCIFNGICFLIISIAPPA